MRRLFSKTDEFRIAYECQYFSLDIVFVKKESFKNGTLGCDFAFTVQSSHTRLHLGTFSCRWAGGGGWF